MTAKTPILPLLLICITSTAVQGQVNADERDATAAALQARSDADTTKLWTTGATVQLNMSQVSLHNWSAGGYSSVSGVGLFNGSANRKKGRHAWDNSLSLAYGILAQEGREVLKTDDRIELNSKYGYEFSKAWYLAALAQFKTQFTIGRDPDSRQLISDLMAPGYLVFGLGMDYKPNDRFSVFMSPATAKVTFVNNQKLADAGAYGVDPAVYDANTGELISAGANSLFEFGGFVKMMYTQDLAKNINFLTRVDFFSNYLKDPEKVVVNWETLFTFKVNDWFAATLNTMLIYDDKSQILKPWGEGAPGQQYVGKGTQFKEAIGLGITFKL